MSPRAALTKHLLDGDDSFLTGNFENRFRGRASGDTRADAAVVKPVELCEYPFDSDAT